MTMHTAGTDFLFGDAWMVNPYKHPWSVTNNGQEVLKEVKYAGHALKNGRVMLKYNLVCNDGDHQGRRATRFLEKDGQMGFERLYRLTDVPKGYDVHIRQQVSSIALAQNLSQPTANGKSPTKTNRKKKERNY